MSAKYHLNYGKKLFHMFIIFIIFFSINYLCPPDIYAQIEFYASDPLDAERDIAISLAREACEKANWIWEDITIKNLGNGIWRITITSSERMGKFIVEVDARHSVVVNVLST